MQTGFLGFINLMPQLTVWCVLNIVIFISGVIRSFLPNYSQNSQIVIKYNKKYWKKAEEYSNQNVVMVSWVLWHINLCRLFNAKSIFIYFCQNSSIYIYIYITIQFSVSTVLL